MQATRGTPVGDPVNAAPVGRRRIRWFAGVAGVVLAADVISKILVVAYLSDSGRVTVVPHVFWLSLTRNSGAAFSVGTGATLLFSVVAIAVVVVIVRAARRLRSRGWAVALGLLLGGALGNLSDRLFRAPGLFRGHVVDWLELPHWPIFNVADSAIVIGGCLIALLALIGLELDGTRR